MNGLLRCLSSLLAVTMLAAPAARAADALNGKGLYLNGPTGGGTACASCHGATPAANVNGIRAAANKPEVISAAFAANLGGMGSLYNGRLSSSEIADLAAFIGNPGVTAAPAASVNPASLGFPATTVGQSASALASTLSNSGNAPLSITALSLSGAAAADYTIGGGSCAAGASLAAGASCTVQVGFKPSAAGARSAALVIAHNATGGSSTVALSGSGNAVPQASIALSSNAIDFGPLVSGIASPARTLSVGNTGQAALNFSSIGFTGANAGLFTLGGTCATATPVPAGGSCTLTVSANASANGPFSGALVLASNAVGGTLSVALSGTVSGPAPGVAASPGAVSFGTQTIGSASVTQDVTLANTGNVALTLNSIGVSGAASVSIASKTCAATLAVGASCSVTLAFAPVAEGAVLASLAVSSNAAPLQVNVSGSGTRAPVGKASLSEAGPLAFPDTAVGKTSASHTLSLNNSGTAALTITSLVLGGAQPGDFVQGGSCAAKVAVSPGTACTLEIGFKPTAAGQRTATAVLMTDTGNQFNLALTGTGVAVPAPQLSLNPQSFDFGATDVGGTPLTHRITLTNTGANPATITAATFAGPFALQAEGSGCAAFPFTLAPGAACDLTLRFTPTAAGSADGSMTLAADGGVPLTLALSGNASVPAVQVPQNRGGGGCSAVKDGKDPVLALLVLLSAGVLLWRRVVGRPKTPS